MAKCCGGASCACVLDAGDHLTIVGSGTSQDPFIITGDVDFEVTDNTVFNLTLDGSGTVADPWDLSVAFAATAKLDDLPDVNAPAPTNAQVLGWDSATSKWTPRAPTTAASGSVVTDTSLDGDGSGGDPLLVITEEAKYVTTRSTGVGLTDEGIKSLVRQYADVTARNAETLHDVGSLAVVDTLPGQVFYWDGDSWESLPGAFDSQIIGSEFLQMSGAYAGSRLTRVLKNVSATTDGNGQFDVLTSSDLSGRAGVLQVSFTPTDPSQTGAAFQAVLFGSVNKVAATAYRLDDGSPWSGVAVAGSVEAWVY